MSSQEFKNAGGEVIKPVMVNVVAPSTLPAGYTFEAFLNDDKNRPFVCEVVRYVLWLNNSKNLLPIRLLSSSN
ncbi:MAG: hypothetical protein ACI8RD_004293 [Bacillariaceae sp.]|jgi:hypothetical protein